jgi:predicted dehydrogenase
MSVRIAFLGTGTFARAHAYALAAMPYHYGDAPTIERVAVASTTRERREAFAARFGFAHAVEPNALWDLGPIDAVFLLGPNQVHCSQLVGCIDRGVRAIYVEKPLCVDARELATLEALRTSDGGPRVQIGYQFLQTSGVRGARRFWAEGGDVPTHFSVRYLHGDYLAAGYRQERRWRLSSGPSGGALADLGSHAMSMLVAFLGPDLDVVAARRSGSLPDVPPDSDLCATVMLTEKKSGAAGTLTASRVSAGSGDLLELEIWGATRCIRFSTEKPDTFEAFEDGRGWRRVPCGSDYDVTTFPSRHVPGGWLRALVHAQWLFLQENRRSNELYPTLEHGVVVQRLLHQAIEQFDRETKP